MFSDVTEMRDAVHLLTPRTINEDVGRPLIREVARHDLVDLDAGRLATGEATVGIAPPSGGGPVRMRQDLPNRTAGLCECPEGRVRGICGRVPVEIRRERESLRAVSRPVLAAETGRRTQLLKPPPTAAADGPLIGSSRRA